MVKPIKRTLTATSEQGSYVGVAKEDKIDIPRDYLLQRIFIDIRGDLDVSTDTTLLEDAGQRCISNFKLEMVGGKTGNKTVVNISGVDLYFLNFYDYGEGLERVTPNTISTANQLVSLQFILDFRLEKKNPDDFSISIPTYDKSQITLRIVWIAIASGYIATLITNVSWTAIITLFEGIPETPEEFEAGRTNPLMTIVESIFTADSSTGVEKRNTDIPTGDLIRRMLFTPRTSGNLRSDLEIKDITLKTVFETLYDEVDWDAISLEDESDYSLANHDGNRAIKGVVMFDFARGAVDERGRVLGFDATGLKSGDIKWEVNKANASSLLRYTLEQIEVVE